MRTQLHHLIAEAADRAPDAPALSFGEVTLSYAALWREVTAAAARLRPELTRGDRVAVYLDKQIETVAACFGASAAGGVVVPVNPLLKPGQVSYLLNDCGVRVLVTSAQRLRTLTGMLPAGALTRVFVVDDEPVEDCPVPVTRWSEQVNRQLDGTAGLGSGNGAVGIDADMAAIFYTSGSTGMPKGVVVSHRNLLVGAESVAEYLGNTADDVILAALPLSFDAGFSQLTTGFQAGAQVVLLNYLLPGDLVRACAKHRVTGLTGVPPLWTKLAEQSWPAEATRHLRYFANTGGRMPKPVLDRLRGLFPTASPYLMYGLTEAFRSTYLDPSQVDARPDSIGKPIPNAEVLVVRPDGSPCEPGEPGELVHRGALVSMGYWNDPARTAERFRPVPGGPAGICVPELAVWSGDTVIRDQQGYLYFVGRQDDQIKTSGYRVSPTEIEEAAYATGRVLDAAALGVDHPRLGQRIVLVVAAAAGQQVDPAAMRQQLKRRLPLYMVPEQVVVVDELPRSPNGKLDRNRVREELQR